MKLYRSLVLVITLAMLAPAALAALAPAGAAKNDDLATQKVEIAPADESAELPKERDIHTTLAGADAACPDSTTPTILESGVGVVGTDTTSGSSLPDCHYTIAVTADDVTAGKRLRVVLAHTSDHDVYVKLNAPATATPYACSAAGTSPTSETCTATTLTAGTYYIRVRRWSSTASDFTVTAFLEIPPPQCSLGTGTTEILDGQTITAALDAVTGATCYFVFNPSLGQDTAQLQMVPPSGSNFDLYVKKGAMPTTTIYDCRPLSTTSVTETCNVANDGTPVYAMVRRSTGTGTFSLTARTFSPCSFGNGDMSLADGVGATASLTSDTGAACFFTFTPSSGFDLAQLTLDSGASNFDLYTKVGSRPTTSSYTCRSITTAADTCSLAVDGTQVVHAMVLRVTGSGDFTITATSLSSCSLGPDVHPLEAGVGVTASLLGVTGAKCYFSFGPDTAADFARFTMTLTTSDFDLYVKKGALPTTTSYDCRPFRGGLVTEECNQLIEDTTTQYAMVRRYSGSGEFTLTATNVIIPILEPGVPQLGEAGHKGFQYWKIIVPDTNAAGNPVSALTVAIGGDASAAQATACAQLDAVVADACDQIPSACDVAEGANPGTCDAIPATGTDADLYVRHRAGLPTTSLYACRSLNDGSVDACALSTDAANAVAQANLAYDGVVAGLPPETPPEVTGALPTGVAAPNVVSFPGPGKYFIGVYGYTGPADYAIVAAYA